MASIRCALVPSALVCMAMFLQGCGMLDKIKEMASGGFAALACDTEIEKSMLSAKNSSLTKLATACENLVNATQIEIQACSEYGSELIPKVFVRVKENATATCVKYVADCEKVDVSDLDEKKNTTSIPEKVDAWTAANMPKQVEKLDAVLNLCIDFAKVQTPELERAATRAYEYTGQVTAESEAFGEANSALVERFAMSGGNKIQAMSTSHAGRWVASACGLLMVMAGVFRFSRRAWLTSSTETDTVRLVNEEDVEGRCEHIAE